MEETRQIGQSNQAGYSHEPELNPTISLGVRKAAARKLTHELGIPQSYELDEFAYLTRIHYYATSDEVWAEHESQSRSSLASLFASLILMPYPSHS